MLILSITQYDRGVDTTLTKHYAVFLGVDTAYIKQDADFPRLGTAYTHHCADISGDRYC